ncbi:hypothetical protein DYL72_15765 [Vibrio anguillarum]|uniref:Uncharacterized protein n=1 Tax=Vibrio anguillarum TaxID=55601 RepID=A0A7U6J3H6_VIBAN|nr:hypothetical protein [Vibrio anguillarum]AZS26361.1 hypothetical protein DYL72_15765 [Vibrio anguillarum]
MVQRFNATGREEFMRTFTNISARTNWRVIVADGHDEIVTRDGAAGYLRVGRKLGRKWQRISNGWILL